MNLNPYNCLINLSRTLMKCSNYTNTSAPRLPSISNSILQGQPMRITRSMSTSKSVNNESKLINANRRLKYNRFNEMFDTLPNNICVISNKNLYIQNLINLLENNEIKLALILFRRSLIRDSNEGGKNVYYSPKTLSTLLLVINSIKYQCSNQRLCHLNTFAQLIHQSIREFTLNNFHDKRPPHSVSEVYERLQNYDLTSTSDLINEQKCLGVPFTYGTYIHLIRSIFHDAKINNLKINDMINELTKILTLILNDGFKIDRKFLDFLQFSCMQLGLKRHQLVFNLRTLSDKIKKHKDARCGDDKERFTDLSNKIIIVADKIEQGSLVASASLKSSLICDKGLSDKSQNSSHLMSQRGSIINTLRDDYKLNIETNQDLNKNTSHLHHLVRISLTQFDHRLAFKQSYSYFKLLLTLLRSHQTPKAFMTESTPLKAKIKVKQLRRRTLACAHHIIKCAIERNTRVGLKYSVKVFDDLNQNQSPTTIQDANEMEYIRILHIYWGLLNLVNSWNGRFGARKLLMLYLMGFNNRNKNDDGNIWRNNLIKSHGKLLYLSLTFDQINHHYQSFKILLDIYKLIGVDIDKEVIIKQIKDFNFSKMDILKCIEILNNQ